MGELYREMRILTSPAFAILNRFPKGAGSAMRFSDRISTIRVFLVSW